MNVNSSKLKLSGKLFSAADDESDDEGVQSDLESEDLPEEHHHPHGLNPGESTSQSSSHDLAKVAAEMQEIVKQIRAEEPHIGPRGDQTDSPAATGKNDDEPINDDFAPDSTKVLSSPTTTTPTTQTESWLLDNLGNLSLADMGRQGGDKDEAMESDADHHQTDTVRKRERVKSESGDSDRRGESPNTKRARGWTDAVGGVSGSEKPGLSQTNPPLRGRKPRR